MAKSITDYLRMLQSLLPRGRVWNNVDGSVLSQFLTGNAAELVRVDSRSGDLIVERDTRATSELLTDHETDLGIPDECSSLATTIQERKNAAHAKFTMSGRQDKQYYIDLVEYMGYTITITEYGPTTFEWDANLWYGDEWVLFRSGESQSGDPITYVPGVEFLICVLNKYKPAHTTVNVLVVGPAFDRAFDSSFSSLPSDQTAYLEGEYSRAFNISYDRFLGGAFSWDSFDSSFNIPA